MRNVVIVPARAGMVAGSPLAAKAYLTPEHLDGIVQRDLRDASPVVQRQTAFLWFVANLQPFPAPGVTYFGFSGPATSPAPFILDQSSLDGPDVLDGSIGGFGQGVFAPPNGNARQFLDEEFKEIIPAEVLDQLAAALPGRWSWIDESDPAPASPELDNPLPRELARLARALETVAVPRGGYGHNSGDAPLTATQFDALVVGVAAAQQRLAAREPIADVQQALAPAAAVRHGSPPG